MKDEIALNENILFRRVAGEGVVVDQRKAQVLVVNEVGVRVLELIRELGSIPGIIDTVAAEFDAEPATIKADVLRFIQQISDSQMTEDVDVSH